MAKKKPPAVPADFYVSFEGAAGQVNVDDLSRGQQVEYTVFGFVRKYEEADRGDGETRIKWVVTIEAAWPKGTKRPDLTDAMIDRDGKVDPEAAGDDADELIPTTGGDDE